MRRPLTFLFLSLCVLKCFSQEKSFIQDPAIGVSFVLLDFESASILRGSSLSRSLKDDNFFKIKKMSPGMSVTFLNGLSKHFDIGINAACSFLDYPRENRPNLNSKNFLLEADASVRAKMYSNKYWISPYVQLGVGVAQYKGNYSSFIPAGVGVQVNLTHNTHLLINSQYRIPVTGSSSFHFYHSFGIAGTIGKKKQIRPLPSPSLPQRVADNDEDGVIDSDDKCPEQRGSPTLGGCPDRDSDGIVDTEDRCPDRKGELRYQGCPIPDRDGDGINDEEDSCSDVKGVMQFHGCPVPDKDNDGVSDDDDKCPDLAGQLQNQGCSVLQNNAIQRANNASKNIFFATGSYKLLSKSFTSLDDVAELLLEDPKLKLNIEGHTDNTGTVEKNIVLSGNRAKAVFEYLRSKGIAIERLSYKGFGQDQPIADNLSTEGKLKNRRVELTVRYD